MKYQVLLLAVVVVVFFSAVAQEITLEIKATGIGQPPPDMGPAQAKAMAKRAAQLDATSKLLAMIKQSMPTPDNPAVDKQIQGFVAGIRYGQPTVLEDGTVTIEAYLSVGQLMAWYEALTLELNECHKALEEEQKKTAEIGQELTQERQRLADTEAEKTKLQQEREVLGQEREKLLQEIQESKNMGETRVRELTTKIEELEQKISGTTEPAVPSKESPEEPAALRSKIAEYEEIEQAWQLHGDELKAELAREREKFQVLHQQNQQLHANHQQTVELLSRGNKDLTELWRQHQVLTGELRDRQIELARLQDKYRRNQGDLADAERIASSWETRYTNLWQAYFKMIQGQEVSGDGQTKLLKMIYQDQLRLKRDVSKIKEWLMRYGMDEE